MFVCLFVLSSTQKKSVAKHDRNSSVTTGSRAVRISKIICNYFNDEGFYYIVINENSVVIKKNV